MDPKLHFLDGDSKLAELFRVKDWSNHILGPPENWAQELKTTISLMLSSKFPMSLAWGKEKIFLYNDGYAELMGEKHPKGLGEKYETLWSEVWKDLVPLLEKVDQGESFYLEDQKFLITRNNIVQETYFTFAYSPIRNLDGTIAGLFCAVVETTVKVISQRELANERDKLNIIFKESSTVMALFQGPEMVYELVNPRYQALFGDRVLVGKPLLEAIPELKGQPFFDQLRDVFKTGTAAFGHEVLAPHKRSPHGPIEDRYYDFTFARINDVNGKPYGIYVHGFDSTDHADKKSHN